MRAFFGVVAGKSEGIISNITTDGSYVYNCRTNGETWLGELLVIQ